MEGFLLASGFPFHTSDHKKLRFVNSWVAMSHYRDSCRLYHIWYTNIITLNQPWYNRHESLFWDMTTLSVGSAGKKPSVFCLALSTETASSHVYHGIFRNNIYSMSTSFLFCLERKHPVYWSSTSLQVVSIFLHVSILVRRGTHSIYFVKRSRTNILSSSSLTPYPVRVIIL